MVKHADLEAAKLLQTQITNDLESSLNTIVDISMDKATSLSNNKTKPSLQQEAANLINALLMLDVSCLLSNLSWFVWTKRSDTFLMAKADSSERGSRYEPREEQGEQTENGN